MAITVTDLVLVLFLYCNACNGFYLEKLLFNRAFKDEFSWLSTYCSFICLEINTTSNLKGHLAFL